MHESSESVARRLHRLQLDRGISDDEMVQRTQIPKKTWVRMTRRGGRDRGGGFEGAIENFDVVCRAIGVSPNEVLGWDD